MDGFLNLDDCLGQTLRIIRRRIKQPVYDALSRFWPYTRKSLKLIKQFLYGQRLCHGQALRSEGQIEATGDRAHADVGQFGSLSESVVCRCQHEILQHLNVFGVND